MSAYFKLNSRGLDYLVSSSENCPSRDLIFSMLVRVADKPASIDQLIVWTGKDQKETTRTLYKMLKQGWLSTVEAEQAPILEASDFDLSRYLSPLSSSGQVVLADMQGLVIASSGFVRDKVEDLAASASRLLAINEAARTRHADLENGQPWRITLNWGSMQATAQLIILGSLKFVLIIGGEPQVDNHSFSNLLGLLARRYVRGQ